MEPTKPISAAVAALCQLPKITPFAISSVADMFPLAAAKLLESFKENEAVLMAALADAGLPEDLTEAMAVILFEHDPLIDSDDVDQMDHRTMLTLIGRYKERVLARERLLGKKSTAKPATPETPQRKLYSRPRTPKRWRQILARLERTQGVMEHSTFRNRTTEGKPGFKYHRSPTSTPRAVELLLDDLGSAYDDTEI